MKKYYLVIGACLLAASAQAVAIDVIGADGNLPITKTFSQSSVTNFNLVIGVGLAPSDPMYSYVNSIRYEGSGSDEGIMEYSIQGEKNKNGTVKMSYIGKNVRPINAPNCKKFSDRMICDTSLPFEIGLPYHFLISMSDTTATETVWEAKVSTAHMLPTSIAAWAVPKDIGRLALKNLALIRCFDDQYKKHGQLLPTIVNFSANSTVTPSDPSNQVHSVYDDAQVIWPNKDKLKFSYIHDNHGATFSLENGVK